MKVALEQNIQGLKKASSTVNLAASRIAKWGLDEPSNGDSVELNGAQRPRHVLRQQWGRGPDGLSPEVDLSEEAIRLKTGEWAFKANIAATRTVLDMERETLELLGPPSKSEER